MWTEPTKNIFLLMVTRKIYFMFWQLIKVTFLIGSLVLSTFSRAFMASASAWGCDVNRYLPLATVVAAR